jgi:hypothetical protein
MQRRVPRFRLLALVGVLAVALGASACGGSKKPPPLDNGTASIRRVSFVVDPGWLPSTARRSIILTGGPKFRALIGLLPRPLPQPALKRPARVCIPATLTIDLANAESFSYGSCQRPKSFRRLLRSLCDMLGQKGFCARYRSELGLPPLQQ